MAPGSEPIRRALPSARAALALAVLLPACSANVPPPVTRSAGNADGHTATPNPANADPSLHPSFGPYDVQTVFYINKSDDHNRVDYGMRLDSHCAPAGDNAVFPYWREFEHAPPVRTHTLKFYEYAGYGFSKAQLVGKSATGGRFLIELKQVARPITIVTSQDSAHHCAATAYAQIRDNRSARLDHIYVELAGVLSVAYVDIHGSDPKSGQPLVERLRH